MRVESPAGSVVEFGVGLVARVASQLFHDLAVLLVQVLQASLQDDPIYLPALVPAQGDILQADPLEVKVM